MTTVWRWARRLAVAVLLVLATLILGGALDARWRLPDLKPWHRLALGDVRSSDLTDDTTLAEYLAREEEVFAKVAALERTIDAADRTRVNRYHPGSLSHPMAAGHNWNRSYETEPAAIRAGALLIHGLTDSPYSMRAVANLLREHGVYSLALRMPGHGTVPAGLVTANAEDWLAAVRLGVRHVRSKLPPGAPLLLVGYSNGGALALKYTFDAIEGRGGPVPSKLILLSPMVGVAPVARLAWWISRLGAVPFFEKANWLDVLPEYNPFKYNSFPANAAFQTVTLTTAVQADLARIERRGLLANVPPVLTFQSVVDATVSTPAVVHSLYDRLHNKGSELVIFDVNHRSGIDVFVLPTDRSLVEHLLADTPRPYRRVVVTNSGPDSPSVEAHVIEADVVGLVRQPLGLDWPPEVFSLSHVSLPFPPDDSLYGIKGANASAGLLPIGRLSPRGERAVLAIGTDTLMRLSSNPFFPFIEERIGQHLKATVGNPSQLKE